MPARHSTPKQRAQAFWAKVEPEPMSGCWLWLGTRDTCGYGMVSYRYPKRITMHASRMAWYLTFGKVPRNKNVLHTCQNRACVRPSHLYIGTQSDNALDAMRDGTAYFARWTHYGRGHLKRRPTTKGVP